MAADFVLKRGETRTVTFELLDAEGAAFDATGFTVTMAINGAKGVHVEKAATLDAPPSLGTGFFVFTASDYAALKPAASPFTFEVWAHDSDENIPMRSGTFDVVDVPQH